MSKNKGKKKICSLNLKSIYLLNYISHISKKFHVFFFFNYRVQINLVIRFKHCTAHLTCSVFTFLVPAIDFLKCVLANLIFSQFTRIIFNSFKR